MGVKIKSQQEQLSIPKAKQALKVKAKPKAKTGDIALTEGQKNTVHLLATVVQQLKELDADALLKEKEGYRKELASLCGQLPAAIPVTLETEYATVVFSAAPETRKIKDMNGLIGVLKEKIGYDGLMALLKLSVGDVESYLVPSELEPFLETVPGSRRLQSAILKS